MIARESDILVPRGGDAAGLLLGIVASGILHASLIVVGVVLPGFWHGRATPAVSYTVDLVASADPAGTNLSPGDASKGRSAEVVKPPAPAEEPPPASAPAAPAPPAVQPEPLPPKPIAAEPPAAPKPPPAAAPQPAAPKAPPAAVPQPVAPQPPVEPAQKAEVKLGSKPVKQPEPKAKPPEPTAVIARATAPVPAKAAKSIATMVPTPAAKVASGAPAREQQIAAAVQRRAQDQQIAAAVQRRTQDQQIADAVQRRAEAAGERTAARGEARGGPVSLGQGTGAGGVVEGLDLILYRGQMERRIKENWVWAGDDPSLEVRIQFDITVTGQIQNVRITGSSGNPSYDASAERAVRAASPMAPPPEKYRELFVHGVEITFRAQDPRS